MSTKILINATILTHNNEAGLNALLWSVYNQVYTPNRIVITNTGQPILSSQLLGTINTVSKLIPIEIRTEENTPHFGELKILMMKPFTDNEVVWMLEDDLIATPTTLYHQQGKKLPNIPKCYELGLTFDDSEEAKKQFEGTSERISLGNIWGLLCKAGDVRDIDLGKWVLGADMKIIKTLNPFLIHEGLMIHSKPTSFKSSYFVLQDKLFKGELK